MPGLNFPTDDGLECAANDGSGLRRMELLRRKEGGLGLGRHSANPTERPQPQSSLVWVRSSVTANRGREKAGVAT